MTKKKKPLDCPLQNPDCEKRKCIWPTLAKERCGLLEVLFIFAKSFQLSKEEEKRRKKETECQEKMLRPCEAARIIGVHPNTLRRWSNEGMVNVYYIGRRGERRFRYKDIVDLRQSLDSLLT